VPKKASSAWTQLSATLGQLEQERARGKVSDLIALALDGFYRTHLETTYDNARARIDDLDQLASYGRQFASLHEFLAQLALLSNVEAEGETRPQQDDERIRLTTVHQAKGLEFDVVFLIMLCDGLFPSARSAKSVEGEEEERRLFYVAITRARNELYLCYPATRSFGVGGAETPQQPSRFLEDLPAELMETWNLHPAAWSEETRTL
jgi:DNA helicase-2/ATP-dependent DNA helicase PcrA